MNQIWAWTEGMDANNLGFGNVCHTSSREIAERIRQPPVVAFAFIFVAGRSLGIGRQSIPICRRQAAAVVHKRPPSSSSRRPSTAKGWTRGKEDGGGRVCQ